MDNHQAPHSLNSTWSSGRLEQLRRFLQTASPIPSANSIQEALQPRSLRESQQFTVGQPRNPNFNRAVNQGNASDSAQSFQLSQAASNPYTLVRRATDITTPLLANDLAQLTERRSTASVSTITLKPEKESPFPVSSHGRDSNFGRMSPNHKGVVGSAPSLAGYPSDKYDPLDCSSSLSFDEMTPERDDDTFDDYQIVKDSSKDQSSTATSRRLYEKSNKSLPIHQDKSSSRPCLRRDYSPSPGFDEMTPERDDDTFDDYQIVKDSSKDQSSTATSRSLYEKSKKSLPIHQDKSSSRSCLRRHYSLSPGSKGSAEPYSKDSLDNYSRRHSRSPDYSIRRYSSDRYRTSSPGGKSKRNPERCHRSSWDLQSSTSRSNQSRRSQERIPSSERNEIRSDTSRRRRRSSSRDSRGGVHDRSSPMKTYCWGSSPQRRHGRSPNRYTRREKRRSSISRSRSPGNHSGSRLEDNHAGRGLHPRGRRSKSRSRSRRSTSTPKFDTNIGHNSRNCKSPSTSDMSRRNDNKSTSSLLVKSPQLDQAVYPSQSESKNEITTTTQKSSSHFIDQVKKIHKHNLGNPGNKFSHLFGCPRQREFLMLSPLPHKGDRGWKDLKTRLSGILTESCVDFRSVAVFPGDGGAPCDYALIRFKTYEDAVCCYIRMEGTIELDGQDGSTSAVFMHFTQNNWKCNACKAMNFALRSFCYKCFWFTKRNKSPIQVSRLVTRWVGIAGIDCRFCEIEEVLAGLPPLNSFEIETYELLMEHNRIPVGLCVFGLRTSQESTAFFTYLRENSLFNPIFVDIVDRVGLEVKPVQWHLHKPKLPIGREPADSLVPANSTVGGNKDNMQEASEPVVFQCPPITDPENNPLLWWRGVEGYVPEEGDHLMLRYLFDEHPDTVLAVESTPAQIFIGPLPIPKDCDLIEFRDQFSRFLQTVGVPSKITERTAFFLAHLFGAPFNYSVIRFENKVQSKLWFDTYGRDVALTLENGSKWPLYTHFTKSNWSCDDCHKLNFPLRVQCYFCYKPRTSNYTPVTIKKSPTVCIGITGFRNWCASKELILKKLPFLRDVKDLDISYMKEPSGIPLGICVLKTPTTALSEMLYNKMRGALTIEFARNRVEDPNRPLLVYIL